MTHVGGYIEEDQELWALGDLSLAVDHLLQITLQQLAPLVNQLLGEVARDLLGGQQVLVDPVVLHKLHGEREGGREWLGGLPYSGNPL